MSERFALIIARVLTTDLKELVKREEGQGVVEYGIVLAFVAVALGAVLVTLKGYIVSFIGKVGADLAALPASL